MRKLEYHELKRFCDPSVLGFKSTEVLEAKKEIIGQDRAVRAFEFGLSTRRAGYNIFVAGISGSGKTTFAARFASLAAAKDAVPKDLAYVYNFKEPKNPKLITTSPGQTAPFKEDLQEMLDILTLEIPKLFEDKDYAEQRDEIIKKFDKRRDVVLKEFSKQAKEKDFEVRFSDKGMSVAPVVDDKAISMEDFEKLPQAEQDRITQASKTVQDDAQGIMGKIRILDGEACKQIEELEYNISLFAVGHQIARLQEKYENEEDILTYLALLKEDILENIQSFHNLPEQDDEESPQHILPWLTKKVKEDVMARYKVNVIIDNNAESKSAPVEVGINATYAGIMGEVEYDSEFGNLTTDYMKIKGGLIHKANGGYLILQGRDVLGIPFLWEALKRTIRSKEITIENPKEHQIGVAVSALRPEPVPFDIKIILVGSSYCYDILRAYDDDFTDLFKVTVLFDYEMDYTDHNIKEICFFIKHFIEKEDSLEFSDCAVAAIIEYSVKLAGSQKKLTGRFDRLTELLTESFIWAAKDNSPLVTQEYVKKAVNERDYRLGLYEEKMGELIENGMVMIDTTGGKIGEINGLASIDTGDYIFAKPTKITATTYVGKAGIVNIENEAEMSGEIHNKGVQIVTGYLGQKYAQDFPLSLSCRVCFEQNYSGIDGDSASSTELYAILSSLAQIPISQEIAVTGSINQKGEIQAVGAITPKIEGFFDLCQKRGLTGTQGVIIPRQNQPDLTLNDEVIKAVKSNTFHIYSITHIDEGIQILMNLPAAAIHDKVYTRLKEFHQSSQDD